MIKEFTVSTENRYQLVDITGEVEKIVEIMVYNQILPKTK